MYQKPPARYVPAAVVFCLGVLLTLFLCVLWQRYYHQARVQAEFEHRAVILADVLQSKLVGHLEALESIGDLYSASTEVERGEFESFILRTVKQHRAIQGLNWVPRVPEERCAEFEIAAQAEGLTNFQFTERNPAGQFIRAGQRAEYFPIYFIAPLVGLRPVLGFDLASDPARRAILEQARDTGQMAATPPIKLVQGTGQDIGVLILLPIYYTGFPTGTLTERRANLQGFGLLALRMDVAIQEALHGWERSGLTLSLVDEAAPLAAGLLYSESPPTRANTLRWGRRLPIADRHWRLEFSFLPAGAPWAPRSSLTIGAILTVGLSLTALLSAYLLTAAHHAIRREQATQALGESEARLAAVITSAMDAIITIDHEQRITLFNAAAERMFRCSAAEVLGQTIDRFIPERNRTVHRGHIQHFGTTGQTTRAMGALGTLSGVRTDGEEFPIEASISKVEIAGHLFFTVILRDMTEHQQAGQVLREQAALAALETEVSRAMTRSESLADMLAHCTEAIVQHLDAAFARIWTLNEADNVLELQASAGMYTHINGPHGRVPVGQFKIGLIARERQPHFTNAVMTDPRVGDKEWASREGMVSFAGYPLMVGDRLFGVIAMFARHPLSEFVLQALSTIATNIALGLERLQAREALRRSESRFRQLAEHIHEVFYLFEVESQQMLYISPAYEQIWGRSTQALYQQSTDFIEAVHPDDRPRVYGMLDQHTRGEQSIIEYRIVRPNGEVRWILDRAFPFRDHPQDGYRVAGVAEDITERKQAEEALRQMNDILEQRVTERTAALSAANTELSKATRLKDEFLASMSHELRTPLNAILGLSEALQEQVYGSMTEKQHQSLHRIEESGRHLLALITDILDLSKIEAGKVELTISPVDAAGVCQASLRLIRENAQQKHLHVTSHVDPAVSTLLADERRLKQMLVNLLSNAVKFTPEEGCVGLEVTGHPDERVVSFTVWDTGIGIADADMERLFQPFVQLDSSLARHHPGTGLGLALVALLADLHGGHVTLESTVGVGSRFSVTVPWRVDTEDNMPSLLPSLLPALPIDGLKRVMLVEDVPTHAEQLVRYLQEFTVNVVVYPHGEGVVDYAMATHPDVILLDLGLPDGSGWDVLARLKAAPLAQAIPVVIVSVMDEPALGLARGAAAYLVKPISREQLQAALCQAMVRRHSPPPAALVTPQDVPPVAGPLLLLAEDNELNVTTIVDYLHAKGYRLAIAGNGAEALSCARALHPALILMDIQMPGMDGLEATRRLRAESDPAVAATPVIALTALTMPGDQERCLAAGANAYLPKPVRLRTLLQTIEAQLKG